MTPWDICTKSVLEKKLKKYKSNKDVINAYYVFLNEVAMCEDPTRMGRRKRGDYERFYAKHLTKSVSVIFEIRYDTHTIYVTNIGDHKSLYGRDNRS